jgi:glycerol-3-phosphate dehydrogenase (NAD(P)+)
MSLGIKPLSRGIISSATKLSMEYLTMATTAHPIAVLGAGSWGTALALYLSRRGHTVRMWTFENDHVIEMQETHVNKRYMPDFPFPATLETTNDISAAIAGAKIILIAVPSVGFRDTLTALQPLLPADACLISATKGLDLDTGELLHDVAKDILTTNFSYAVLSGPSFAREVAAGLPTAVVIASKQPAFAQELLPIFNSAIFRIYLSDDIIGVEIGGVAKNVLAIATGISDGMGFGANARSALITRGLVEMTRLGVKLGGVKETFSGLAGLGDLILTCTDDQSRNRRFGLALANSKSPKEAEAAIGQVVEGKRNAELLNNLAERYDVDMPITAAVWEILQGEIAPKVAMENLLAREPKAER